MTSYNLLMCRFYDSRRALVSDPDYGPLLSSLLVGPCALEYSKATFADQYWYVCA
jgi:hypothetical protein